MEYKSSVLICFKGEWEQNVNCGPTVFVTTTRVDMADWHSRVKDLQTAAVRSFVSWIRPVDTEAFGLKV